MAEATMDEKWSIEKLDGSNRMTWRFQMRHLLLAKELWGYVDGTEVLGEDATPQARAEFQKKTQKAFSTIVMAVNSSQLYLITSVERPKDAWDALRNHFERDTLANKLMLKKQYFRMEMKEGMSMEAHLKSMKELTDRLAAIGAPISEEDQVVTLLGSLPQSYSTLVTALEARVDGMSLSYVQQALIHEERKNEDQAKPPISGGQQSALIGKQGKKFKCYGCGEAGHFRRDCPKRKPHTAKSATEESHTDSESEESTGAFVVTANSCEMTGWLVDSGASSHMTCKRELLMDYEKFQKPETVNLGDGRTVEVVGVGNVHLNMKFKVSDPKRCVMHRVLHVPKLACNLFSVRAAASKGNVVKFAATRCWIRNSKGNLCGMGSLRDKMYQLNCEPVLQEQASVASEKGSTTNLWHQRLGHLNESLLKKMVSDELVTGVKIPTGANLSFCESCVEGKMQRKPFKPVGEIRSKRKLQCVHSDVCGPMPTQSIGGKRYFVTFIDDYSRCCRVYFMRHKSEVPEKFKEFEAVATADSGQRIGTLRSDNGGEYGSQEFEVYLKSKGIQHELTVSHSPQQNGVAERMNRTLMESARSMLAHAGLPDSYWAEAVATAAYLRNRTPTTALKGKVTPYEQWYGRKPNLSHLKVFGCMAYAHIPDSKRTKLDKKAEKVRFIGYSIQSKGYRLIDERTSKVIIRRDVIFNEVDFGHQPDGVEQRSSMEVDVDNTRTDRLENVEPEREREEERRYPERLKRAPTRFGIDEYADLACTEELGESQIDEPTSIEEALASDLAEEWKAATHAEYQSLMENDTWDLVEPPSGCKPIGCKWIFKAKRGKDGKVERYKARLVAKGYTQRYGIDYGETFSPVVRFPSIRALLAFAVQNDMLVHQMDVVTAFLNGDLEEELYMEQPFGYIQPGKENLVCKLKKSLYGLKQSSRCWNTTFRKHMESIYFRQSTVDPCVFIRVEDTSVTIVAVYVDDLIIITKTPEKMEEVKASLAAQFKMKDLGKLHYCLGITVEQDDERECLWLHQKQYIMAMLKKFGLSQAKPATTPADVSVKLRMDDGVSKTVDPIRYQSMVGSLLYAATATRPDIAQAVAVVSKFNARPNEAHLTAVKRIFRYLKGTVDLALKYEKKEGAVLTGYSDADWAGDQDDRHSTTGNLFIVSGGPVSWLSKKQPMVSLSTSEAEYVALSIATQAVWLRRLFDDLQAGLKEPTVVMEDNQGTIAMAKNPVSHTRTKHIDIRYHYVREAVQDGLISLLYCPTEVMIADLLTKPLSRERFETLRLSMGLEPSPTVPQPVN